MDDCKLHVITNQVLPSGVIWLQIEYILSAKKLCLVNLNMWQMFLFHTFVYCLCSWLVIMIIFDSYVTILFIITFLSIDSF